MMNGLYTYGGVKLLNSLLIFGLVTCAYRLSVVGSLAYIHGTGVNDTTAHMTSTSEASRQELCFSCPCNALMMNCCVQALGVPSSESGFLASAFNLSTISIKIYQHSRLCESKLRRKLNQLLGCSQSRSWKILFHDVNEYLVDEIGESMNEVGAKFAAIRMQLSVDVTEALKKVKSWEGMIAGEETSFLVITSPEMYKELMSSLQVYCPHSDCDVRLYAVADSGISIPWSCTSTDRGPMGNRNYMTGRHVIASTNEWPPFVIRVPTEGGRITYEGFCIDIWKELADRLNFTYEFVEPSDGQWGKLVNGTWTGLVGQLQKREVDVAVAPLSAQPARAPVMDVSQSYLQLEGKLLVARNTETHFHNLLYVFTTPVLVLLTVVPLLVAVLLVGLERLVGKDNHNSWTNAAGVTKLSNAILLVYGAVVCQASPFRPQSVSGRTLVAFWWLFGIVFFHTFSALMVANLAAPSTKHEVSSLKDLVNAPQYKWGMLGSTIFPLILKNSNNVVFQKLWQGISKHREEDELVLSDDFQVHLQRMKSEKYAYIGPVPALSFYNASHCDFRSGRDSFFTARYVFGLQKNSPYTEIISRELLGFEELGFMLAIKRRWFHIPSTCDYQVHHTQTVVGLVHVQAAYLALALGIATAGIVLISENILKLCRKIIVANKTR